MDGQVVRSVETRASRDSTGDAVVDGDGVREGVSTPEKVSLQRTNQILGFCPTDRPSSVACESGTILFAVTKCCLINHQSVSQSEADALSQVSNILHLFQAAMGLPLSTTRMDLWSCFQAI